MEHSNLMATTTSCWACSLTPIRTSITTETGEVKGTTGHASSADKRATCQENAQTHQMEEEEAATREKGESSMVVREGTSMETTREEEEVVQATSTSMIGHLDTKETSMVVRAEEASTMEVASTKEAREQAEVAQTLLANQGDTMMTTMLLGTILVVQAEVALEAMRMEAEEALVVARLAEEEAGISKRTGFRDLTTGESTMQSMHLMCLQLCRET